MSTTATETQTQPAQAPEITVLTRVASIPMISSSLGTINDTLSSNTYTRFSYNHAKGLSTTAYKLTEPIQVKLAPLIVRADTYANMAVDAVESRYPYPFKAQPEEVATYVRERKAGTTNYVHERVNDVNKAIDEKVKTPAYNVAQGIDQRFTPIVDYIELRLNGSEAGPSTPNNDQFQYQRALALSNTLRENVYDYTSDQLKHIQAQSKIVQKASETAASISTAASSSLASVQGRIHSLSDTMIAELQKLQVSTTSLTTSLQTSIQTSATQIQSQVPKIERSYSDLSAALSSAANELTRIVTQKDLALHQKLALVGKEVQERVTPLLDTIKHGVSEVLSRSKEAAEEAPTANGTNGNANADSSSEVD